MTQNRSTWPAPDRLLRITEVLELIPVGRASFMRAFAWGPARLEAVLDLNGTFHAESMAWEHFKDATVLCLLEEKYPFTRLSLFTTILIQAGYVHAVIRISHHCRLILHGWKHPATFFN